MKKNEVIVDKCDLNEVVNELKFKRLQLSAAKRELEIFNGMLELGLRVKERIGVGHCEDSVFRLLNSQRDLPKIKNH